MLVVVSFIIMVAVGHGVSLELQPLKATVVTEGQVPVSGQVVFLHDLTLNQQYTTPTQRAAMSYILIIPQNQDHQISQSQSTDAVTIDSIHYNQPQQKVEVQHSQHQHIQASNRVPLVQHKIKPVPVSATVPSKPLDKSYQVHEMNQEPHWSILRQSRDEDFKGNFQHDFKTENGIFVEEVGTLRQLGPNDLGQAVQGTYSYTAPDGRVITTSYTADERGFLAQGDHLPVAPEEPELPPLIAKSLAYIRSLPPQPEYQ